MAYREPTAQDLFRKIWRWFVVDKKSLSRIDGPGSPCKYRGPNGTKCAVGVVIPDRHYKASFDDEGTLGLVLRDEDLGDLQPHLHMLERLQHLHDVAHSEAVFAKDLRAFAKHNKYGVRAPRRAA